MNFIEFVMAMGEKNLAQLLQTKDWNMITMFAPKFQELLKYYYYVGGMPEAVLSFSQRRDWKEVRAIQKDILITSCHPYPAVLRASSAPSRAYRR